MAERRPVGAVIADVRASVRSRDWWLVDLLRRRISEEGHRYEQPTDERYGVETWRLWLDPDGDSTDWWPDDEPPSEAEGYRPLFVRVP